MLHKKSSVFIEYDEKDQNQEEKDADKFASSILIPQKDLYRSLASRYPTREEIIALSDELQISPGILVGRLQYEGIIPQSHFNDLRERYCWATRNKKTKRKK